MNIETERQGNHLVLMHEESKLEVIVESTETGIYNLTLANGHDLTPQEPIYQKSGESDENFFNRAAAKAFELMGEELGHYYEGRARLAFGKELLNSIDEALNLMKGTVANWEWQTELTRETDVANLQRIHNQLDALARALASLN